MKIRLVHDWALIRPDRGRGKIHWRDCDPGRGEGRTSKGCSAGDWTRPTKDERNKQGKVTQEKFEKPVVKPGNRVLYDKYGETKVEGTDKEFLMMGEKDTWDWLSRYNCPLDRTTAIRMGWRHGLIPKEEWCTESMGSGGRADGC